MKSLNVITRRLAFILFIVLAAVVWRLAAQISAADNPNPDNIVIESPNQNIRIVFGLYESADKKAVPSYSVSYRGQELVRQASMGIDLATGGSLDKNFKVVKVARSQGDKTYTVFPGKTSKARDHYREAVITLEERSTPRRQVDLVFRAYDDGAAFQYRFPAQPALQELVITDEPSTFAFICQPQAYTLQLGKYTTSYDKKYHLIPLHHVSPEALLGLPLLLEFPSKTWVAVTEADLTDYAGMYLAGVSERPGVLISRLSPWPENPQVKVKARLPHVSPWRVLMIADDPGRLIESNLITNLNEPCAIADTSWIKPGKTTFPWWNGYAVGDAGFSGGLNTETMKHYLDFCAEAGIEYHSLDGFENVAWYGGPIVPYQGADITKSLSSIDLDEVRDYARRKGVRLRLWMHWQAAQAHMKTAFPIYERWGIEGVMVDFMDRDDQHMVNFYHDLIRLAARHHLTVTLHGAYKPTGLGRTYPNLLTIEGVLNLEYNKWDEQGVTPEYELTVPFTRMLAGPLDFHQGSFRHVWPGDYKPRNIAPVVMGTRARALASYVIYENHLPMLADYPAAYRNQPGLDFLAQVPTTWDETRVLNGVVGKYLTIARRRGARWYVGSMTDGSQQELTIPLNFLGPGKYIAEIWADDPDAPDQPSKLILRKLEVTSADTIRAALAHAGGHVVRLTPNHKG